MILGCHGRRATAPTVAFLCAIATLPGIAHCESTGPVEAQGPESSSAPVSRPKRLPHLPPPEYVAHGNFVEIRISEPPRTEQVSNSLEGLEAKYRFGHTLLETDFEWTSDGHLVVIHDWGLAWDTDFIGTKNREVPPRERFLRTPMCYGLTQLDVPKLNAWLAARDGVYIVTDIKKRNGEGMRYLVETDPTLATRRYIPQIKHFREYELARRLGFRNIILTVYQLDPDERTDEAIYDFVSSHDLYALTIHRDRVASSDLTQRLQRDLDLPIYVHPTSQHDLTTKEVYKRETGVTGFYTYGGNPWAQPFPELDFLEAKEICSARVR